MAKTKKNEQKEVLDKIQSLAQGMHKDIVKLKQPEIIMPLRALVNVRYDNKEGYFKLLGKKKGRTLTASTIKTFAQTLRMMELSKKLVETDDIATKREAYYVSKNWGEARFNEQPESDTVMDDIEAIVDDCLKTAKTLGVWEIYDLEQARTVIKSALYAMQRKLEAEFLIVDPLTASLLKEILNVKKKR